MSSLSGESFVILGSSPTQSVDEVSLREDVEAQKEAAKSSTNNLCQSSIRNGNVIETQGSYYDGALFSSTGSVSAKDLMIWSRPSNFNSQVMTEMDSFKVSNCYESSTQTDQQDESLTVKKKPSLTADSLETKEKQSIDLAKKVVASTSKTAQSLIAAEQQGGAASKDENLAAGFIMGDISANDLKVSPNVITKYSIN